MFSRPKKTAEQSEPIDAAELAKRLEHFLLQEATRLRYNLPRPVKRIKYSDENSPASLSSPAPLQSASRPISPDLHSFDHGVRPIQRLSKQELQLRSSFAAHGMGNEPTSDLAHENARPEKDLDTYSSADTAASNTVARRPRRAGTADKQEIYSFAAKKLKMQQKRPKSVTNAPFAVTKSMLENAPPLSTKKNGFHVHTQRAQVYAKPTMLPSLEPSQPFSDSFEEYHFQVHAPRNTLMPRQHKKAENFSIPQGVLRQDFIFPPLSTSRSATPTTALAESLARSKSCNPRNRARSDAYDRLCGEWGGVPTAVSKLDAARYDSAATSPTPQGISPIPWQHEMRRFENGGGFDRDYSPTLVPEQDEFTLIDSPMDQYGDSQQVHDLQDAITAAIMKNFDHSPPPPETKGDKDGLHRKPSRRSPTHAKEFAMRQKAVAESKKSKLEPQSAVTQTTLTRPHTSHATTHTEDVKSFSRPRSSSAVQRDYQSQQLRQLHDAHANRSTTTIASPIEKSSSPGLGVASIPVPPVPVSPTPVESSQRAPPSTRPQSRGRSLRRKASAERSSPEPGPRPVTSPTWGSARRVRAPSAASVYSAKSGRPGRNDTPDFELSEMTTQSRDMLRKQEALLEGMMIPYVNSTPAEAECAIGSAPYTVEPQSFRSKSVKRLRSLTRSRSRRGSMRQSKFLEGKPWEQEPMPHSCEAVTHFGLIAPLNVRTQDRHTGAPSNLGMDPKGMMSMPNLHNNKSQEQLKNKKKWNRERWWKVWRLI